MRRRWSLLAGVFATVVLFANNSVAASRYRPGETIDVARGCPSARTCSVYAFEDYRWPVVNHRATVSFVINPTQPFMTAEQAQGGIVAAAQTWAAADPSIKINYLGTTTSLVTTGDGINEIGWGILSPSTLATSNVRTHNGVVVEADVVINSLYVWSWTPCSQRNQSCTAVPAIGGAAQPAYDIQDVLTHEFGHWLGLAHIQGNATTQLTMTMTKFPGERKADTLAEGDVLGIRALYPCKCKRARIVDP